MKRNIILGLGLFFFNGNGMFAQDGNALLLAVKNKLDNVYDYQASGKLKTNVAFIKAPVADVKIYYKKPDKLKIVNASGISFIPRGSVNINLNRFLNSPEQYQVLDAGLETGTGYRVLKLLPVSEQADIVLATLYIDEKTKLIRKAKNTTRDNGTYELEMIYGKYSSYALPDKVIFTFNTKEYKLPKGITFDYDTGFKNKADTTLKNKTGKVEISYTTYIINKGIEDRLFDQQP